MTRPSRPGFTMLTVLWLLAVASSVTVAAAAVGRISIETGRNRVHLDRAYWLALGCARQIQAAADVALRGASSPSEGTRVWAALPANIQVAVRECDVAWEAAGTRLDLNAASEEMLTRLMMSAGAPMADADQFARAVEARRADESFSDARELRRVPGYVAVRGIDSLTSADIGRVFLASASAIVLSAIPGVTRETADLIAQRARDGEAMADLTEALPLISAISRDSLIARFPDATRVTTGVPDGWLLQVRAGNGEPRGIATLRWRLMRNGDRAVITQARVMP